MSIKWLWITSLLLLVKYCCIHFLHRSVPASRRTPLPPRPRQNRAVVITFLFPETVSLPARGLGPRQPLPQCHPREERLPTARLQWAARRFAGRRCWRGPTKTKGRAGIRRLQWLPTPRPPEVPVSFWRCHETAGSAGQREASSGRRVRHRGFWSFQNLPADRQHPARCFCQGFCLQVSGESEVDLSVNIVLLWWQHRRVLAFGLSQTIVCTGVLSPWNYLMCIYCDVWHIH